MSAFEAKIRELIRPINCQYPRPWMTESADPEHVRVFIVGRNQATKYCAEKVGDPDIHVDALFNRNGQTCLKLYEQMRGGGKSSLARGNIRALREALGTVGVSDVIETNVICYSTRTYKELSLPKHKGGKIIGENVFREILRLIRPRVLIAHGAGTAKDLRKFLGQPLPAAASHEREPVASVDVEISCGGSSFTAKVFVIPSLAPPAWNRWQKWAQAHLDETSRQVRNYLAAHP